MFNRSRALIGLIAAAGLAAFASPLAAAASAIPLSGPVKPAERKRITPQRTPGGSNHRKAGPGWSNRHVKRMKAKRLNRARNKSHHRRSRGFTVIEVLIVMAILGILSAVIAAGFGTSKTIDYSYGTNGITETRCIGGTKWVIGRNGNATQMLDTDGKAVPCPTT